MIHLPNYSSFRECHELIDDIRQMSLRYVSADGWIRHFDRQVEEALRAALLKQQQQEEEEAARREEEEERLKRQEDRPPKRRLQRTVRIICFDCHRYFYCILL
jgi:hypothetical protein